LNLPNHLPPKRKGKNAELYFANKKGMPALPAWIKKGAALRQPLELLNNADKFTF
jgi:hypothetical protein